jgi:tetratricopeptide (TPR) repeat protein
MHRVFYRVLFRNDHNKARWSSKRLYLLLGFLSIGLALAAAGCGSAEQKFQEHFDRGRKFFEEGRTQEAILELKTALQENAQDPDAHYLLGEAYLKEKDVRNAFKAFHQAVTLKPDLLDAQLKLATLYTLGNQPDKAREALKTVLEKDPDNVEGLILDGGLLAREEKYDEAMGRLQRALELDNQRTDASILLARCFLATGKLEEAERTLLASAERDATPRSLYALAQLYMALRDAEKAEDVLLQVVDKFPEQALHDLNLARFYIQQGRFEDAEQELLRGVEKAPDQPAYYATLAAFYLGRAQPDKAEEILRKAVEAAPDRVEPRLALGRFWAAKGDTEKALDMLEKAREQHPDDLRPYREIIRIYYDQGRSEEALAEIQTVLGKSKKDAYARLMKARILARNRQYRESLEILMPLIKDEPNLAEAYFVKSMCHVSLGEENLARDALGKTLELAPAHPRANMMMAEFLLRDGDTAGARQRCEEAIRRTPRDIRAHMLLGRIALTEKDADAAEKAFLRVKELEPANPAGYMALGALYRSENRLDEALKEYEAAWKAAPGSFPVARSIVLVHTLKGDYDKALAFCDENLAQSEQPELKAAHLALKAAVSLTKRDLAQAESLYREALKFSPDWPTPYLHLARIYTATGRLDEAIRNFEAVAAKQPKFVGALMSLGVLYQIKGEPRKAEEYYERILEVRPDFAPAANNLAWLLVEQGGNIDRALTLAQMAKEKMPDDPAVADTLGWIYVHKKAYGSAIAQFEDALEKIPDNPSIRYHLAVALSERGDKERARIELEKILAKDATFPEREEAVKLLEQVKG